MGTFSCLEIRLLWLNRMRGGSPRSTGNLAIVTGEVRFPVIDGMKKKEGRMVTGDEVYIKLAEKNRKADSRQFIEILKKAMSPEEALFLLGLPASNADLAA
ncbi:MAG: hypothetical protein NTU41_03500, partial [Chloroflexi bacterium]|nr:hypothetical protein [Chloroflexota bacterium]